MVQYLITFNYFSSPVGWESIRTEQAEKDIHDDEKEKAEAALLLARWKAEDQPQGACLLNFLEDFIKILARFTCPTPGPLEGGGPASWCMSLKLFG